MDVSKLTSLLGIERALNGANSKLTGRMTSVGTYAGDGRGSKTIALGFKPVLVIVFAVDEPLTYYSNNTNYPYAAIITQLGASAGGEMTDNGFTVHYSSLSSTGIALRLNAEGKTYIYVVFK